MSSDSSGTGSGNTGCRGGIGNDGIIVDVGHDARRRFLFQMMPASANADQQILD